MGPRDHVAEGAVIVFAQPTLNRGEDTGNFRQRPITSASAQLLFRLRDPGDRSFATLQRRTYSAYFSGVTSSSWQRLKNKQIIQKLSDIGRPNVVFEMKLMNSFAKINP